MFSIPWKPETTPWALVIVLLAVVSTVFGVVTGLAYAGSQSPVATAWMVSAVAVYAGSIAALSRIALSNIQRLQKESTVDGLTSLPNRRALHTEIARYGTSDQEISVALIDLDGFKLVNDLYGHAMGDRIIRECAAIMTEVCGTHARCFRLGGDEFAISMTGPLSNTILEGMCRGLIERLSQPILTGDREISVGASVGLSHSKTGERLSSSEMLRQADVAMYASKRGGRMRCTWFKPDFDRNLEAIRDLDEELRQALLREEFEVHYQPLVGARDRKVVAVESLLRWNRPDGKPVSPNVFIPVAEESGLINPIGLFVLRQSCMDALGWNGIKLSVNISAAQLRNPEFPIQLGQILEETGFEPERLELEITETCLVLDPVVAEKSLDLIRGFGVNVVLDDFGTGYASIGFLRQFRFEKLKIDRSLVVDSEGDEGSRAMMLSSISMAQALKMNVTAEGVETEAQADLVRAAGCDQIQGWLYYKAMPRDEIAQHLSTATKAETEVSDRSDA